MNIGDTCYRITRGHMALEKALKDNYQEWKLPIEDAVMIATMHSVYNQHHAEDIIPMFDENANLKEIAEKLKSFKDQLLDNNKKKISQLLSGKNDNGVDRITLSTEFQNFRKEFGAAAIIDVMNLISDKFIHAINFYLKQAKDRGIQCTREDIVRGINVDGMVINQDKIFYEVFRWIAKQSCSLDSSEKSTIYRNNFIKVLNNWPIAVVLAKYQLSKLENLPMNYGKKNNGDLYEVDDIDTILDQEESTRESWQEVKDQVSAFGSIGVQIKRILYDTYDIERMDENGNPVYKRDSTFGLPKKMSPMRVHQMIMDITEGTINSSHMIRKLEKASKQEGYEWLQIMLKKYLQDPTIRTKFFTDICRDFQPFVMSIHKLEKGIMKIKTKILNRKDKGKGSFTTILANAKKTATNNTIFTREGTFSNTIIDKLSNALINLYTTEEVTNSDNSKTIKYNPNYNIKLQDKKAALEIIFRSLGIKVSKKEISQIATNRRYYRSVIVNAAKMNELTLIDKESLAHSIRSGENKDVTTTKVLELVTRGDNSTGRHPFVEHAQAISDMVAAVSSEGKYERSALYIDKKGNTARIQSYVAPSYLGDFIKEIKERSELGNSAIQGWLLDKYGYCPQFSYLENGNQRFYNRWMQDLWNSSGDTSFASQIQFLKFVGTEDTHFENIGPRDHMLDMLAMYFMESEQSTNAKFAWYPVFILGDSNVSKYIKAPIYSIDGERGIISEHLKLYKSEIERMKLAINVEKKIKGGIEEFNKNTPVTDNEGNLNLEELGKKNKFSILTFLNQNFKFDNGVSTSKYYDIAAKQGFSDAAVLTATEEYLKDSFELFKEDLQNLGVLDIKDTNARGESIYLYLDNFIQGFRRNNPILNSTEKNVVLDEMLRNFYYNTKFATIQQIQMLTIDPSFYVGTKDLQKRYKEMHASGNKLDNSDGDTQKVVYFNDISTNIIETNPEVAISYVMHNLGVTYSEASRLVYDDYNIDKDNKANNKSTVSELKKKMPKAKYIIFNKYKDNTLTDGQAYRSLRSYKKVMQKLGQWTDQHEAAFKEIENMTGELTAEQIDRLKALAVTFQPIKPYMYTVERYPLNADQEALIPVQHKYAEAIIIPQLHPVGSKLRALGEAMNEKGIDMIMSTKCVKVGIFGACNISSASSKEDILTSFGDSGTYIHEFSYGDIRIQNSITDHTNQVRAIGTQARKLVMSNLPSNKDCSSYFTGFLHSPKNTQGKDVLQYYNSLIMANIMESFAECVEELVNKEGLSKTLIENVISSSQRNLDTVVAYALGETSEDFVLPLFEGTLKHDSLAMLLSIFKNRVNKQKILGGSAVQVSAMGIKGFEESDNLKAIVDPNNPSNILYAECEMPFNLTYEVGGRTQALDFNTYCDPDGTIKLSDITFEDNEDRKIIGGKVFLKQDYLSFKNDKGKITIPKIELVFPHILDKVAYRIPTERAYSMLNLKVVRFSSPVLGGIIKVPSQYTTIAGFDFDIDKLYFLSYEYKVTESWRKLNISAEDKKSIFNKIKEDHPEFVIPTTFTTEVFTQSQRHAIFAQIYNNWPAIYNDLVDLRGDNKKYALHSFFEKSPVVKMYAKEQGLTVAEFKNKLFAEALTDMEEDIHPILVEQDSKYFTFDREAISREGLTLGKLFSEAAKALGIELSKSTLDTVDVQYEEYDFSKNPLEQSKAARNNAIIALMRSRLMDEDTYDERYTPGGFPTASYAARGMRNLMYSTDLDANNLDLDALFEDQNKATDPEPNYDFSNPMTIVRYNEQNQIASKLIGVAANQNTNHALSSLAEALYVKNIEGLTFGKMLTHAPRAEMKEGKVSNGDIASVTAGSTLLARYIKYSDGSVVDVDLNLAELLAASVDAVKDPVLNYLNINSSTVNIACLLMRLGYSMTDIGLFLNQPIIKEVCREAQLNSKGFLATAIATVKENLKQQLGREVDRVVNRESNLSSVGLAKNILNSKKGIDNADTQASQLQVLEMFAKYAEIATELSQYVGVTKFTAANSVGSTEGDLYAQQSTVESYLDKFIEMENNGKKDNSLLIGIKASRKNIAPIISDPALLKLLEEGKYNEYMEQLQESPYAYEQLMYDCNRLILKKLDAYYPYEQKRFKAMRKAARLLSKTGKIKASTINMLHSDAVLYLLCSLSTNSNMESLFNPARIVTRENGSTTTAKEYYTLHFANELFSRIQEDPELASYGIFKYLSFPSKIMNVKTIRNGIYGEKVVTSKKEVVTLSIDEVSAMEQGDKQEITDAWLDLYNNEKYRDLAEKLFFHGFFNGGLGFSAKTIMHLCPTVIKANMPVTIKNEHIEGSKDVSYAEFLNELLEGQHALSYLPQDFYKMFILNNINLWDFKHHIYKHKDATMINNMVNNNILEIDSSSSLHDKVTYKAEGKLYYVPVISYVDPKTGDTLYFMANNTAEGVLFNQANKDGSIQYVKVDVLGEGNVKNYSTSLDDAISSSAVFEDTGEISENITPEEGAEVLGPSKGISTEENVENALIEELAEAYSQYFINLLNNSEELTKDWTNDDLDILGTFMGSIGVDPKKVESSHDKEEAIKEMIRTSFRNEKLIAREVFERKIKNIRDACRKNGLLVLDQYGNLMKNC